MTTRYAQVTDGEIAQVVSRPRNLVRLDDGSKPLWSEYIDAATLAACGWFPVADNPPTFDPDTEVRERGGVVLVDGTPTVLYTVRPLTADELAAKQQAAEDVTERDQARQAVTNLRSFIDNPSPTVAQTVGVVKLLCRVAIRLIRDQYGR